MCKCRFASVDVQVSLVSLCFHTRPVRLGSQIMVSERMRERSRMQLACVWSIYPIYCRLNMWVWSIACVFLFVAF